MKTILEPGLQKEAINDLADYCLCIAQHMEEQTQQTNTILLDETNRSCVACARATGHQTWYSPDNRHSKDIITTMTCAGIDGTGKTAEFQQFDLATELDFVSYAIVFELFLYARAKVSEDPSLSQKSDRMPVLHAMHCGAHPGLLERFSKPSWHSLLRTLFDQGADPNFEYKGKTAWR